MAKKAASATNRPKAHAKGRAKASQERIEAAASALELVDEEERAVAQRTSTKRLRRRNTDETVAKCLRDNFVGWEASQTDHFLVDGRSLRQQLSSDRRRLNAGDADAPKLGKRYYDTLRERFSSAKTPSKRLKVYLLAGGLSL